MRNDYDKCANCGGAWAIHHYRSEQCPVNGVEAPVGQKQEWKTSSTFTSPAPPFNPPDRLAKDMTIREHFAAMAMQGLCQGRKLNETPDTAITHKAVRMADALVAALNAESK